VFIERKNKMNPEHHHTFLQWLNHNWAVISLVYFPAFLGYLNAFVASCKVMGWSKLATELGKIEDAIKVFVDTLKTQGGSNVQKDSGSNSSSTDTVVK
jgi:hypothetical protein